MCELIGNVKLNLKFYKGKDYYSDGDIEDEILEMVKKYDKYDELIYKDNRWAVLYHLSKLRENIIEWYPFKENSEVLEIGSGCGAITGVLCDKSGKVTCIELSKKRSTINAYRNRYRDNLEIIVGNLNDVKLDKKFDYITLIGVLEYSRYYTNTTSPCEDFLKNIKKFLKEDGKLIIAIENKFGLKYWAGCREDHTGNFFDSLENYTGTKDVITFSKEELKNILNTVGFKNLDFYYPMPDYKFPSQIFSDNRLPGVGELRNLVINYDQDRLLLFDEGLVYDNIIENGKFDFFANSFLVFCGL
ncbi:class I SAM-dependent methyltransferase [Tepidibacter thalassicus]|uniref:Methyltransferase domain-containing protein n=1 Tax=Tepidibacter thalassicus DSM 15285 TaxID=1123350 RepID=A0A1M5S683_9FIRM|nr:class I SAM-dependent methyltransferase [Tepidibacter thalassicus]SHH33950.1 Methyltransferase domain-containing protein [Tepidibacter thalassicus DSM 15285]